MLILSWGSTYGAAYTAATNLQMKGYSVSNANLRYLNPFPKNLEEILKSFEKILVPEMNKGQLQFLIQAKYAIKVFSQTKVQGKPFHVGEIEGKAEKIMAGDYDE